MENLVRWLGQLRPLKMLMNERGEVVIPPAGDPPAGDPPAGDPPAAVATWKGGLSSDMKGSPLVQNYEDTPEGLNKAFSSYAQLEQLLGHEKVPIPKGDDDTDGWDRFSKAMGIPEKANDYGLSDPEIPEGMKNLTFGKEKFSEVVHAFKLTPGQAKGLWGAYTDMSKEAYTKFQTDAQATLDATVNVLRGEWGDTYDSNVELGQMVINKFAADQDTQDYLTAALSKDPKGVKFLARLGNQFAEMKVGEFGYKRFSLSADQAQAEIDTIIADKGHPYNNDKASPIARDKAIDYVNSLYSVIAKATGQINITDPHSSSSR